MVARYRNFFSVSETELGETRLGAFYAGLLAMLRAEDARSFMATANMRMAFGADQKAWAKYVKEAMPV